MRRVLLTILVGLALAGSLLGAASIPHIAVAWVAWPDGNASPWKCCTASAFGGRFRLVSVLTALNNTSDPA